MLSKIDEIKKMCGLALMLSARTKTASKRIDKFLLRLNLFHKSVLCCFTGQLNFYHGCAKHCTDFKSSERKVSKNLS